MEMRLVWIAVLSALPAIAAAAVPCPAGVPLGDVDLAVARSGIPRAIPLRSVNRLVPGDRIVYTPLRDGGDKRKGQVALLLAPSEPDGDGDLELLPPKPASDRAEWPVNGQTRTAAFVYGPAGLNAAKVKRFLARDPALIGQLADYAQNTARTEEVLRALASDGTAGTGDNLGAAIQGFATQYGLNNRINRDAPPEQQTLALFRAINPALASYDPISPQGPQRVSQTASLAAVVAGMFLGNPVGLAAGGAAIGMNFRSILFPNTEFRSAFAQPGGGAMTLCGKREPARGRAKLAYFWAVRVPGSEPPKLAIDGRRHAMIGARSPIGLKATGPAPLDRVRNWQLAGPGRVFDIGARTADGKLEIDLTGIAAEPGEYRLRGHWDEAPFEAAGTLVLHARPDLSSARIGASMHDRLVEDTGKQAVALEGPDFQFVEKMSLVRIDDRFASPAPIPWRLPEGPGLGAQRRVEIEIDTAGLKRGAYRIAIAQAGSEESAPLEILAPQPRLDAMPLRVHSGEANQQLTLEGDGVERLVELRAQGVALRLGPAIAGQRRRPVEAAPEADLRPGQSLDLHARAEGWLQPARIAGGVRVLPPRPAIVISKVLAPAGVDIALREGELVAGVAAGAVLDVKNAGPRIQVELGCPGSSRKLRAAVGEQRDGLKVQSLAANRLYLSFDPAAWPSGCEVEATLEAAERSVSAPKRVGRVVRLPKVERFQWTEDRADDGAFFGTMTGRDLESVEKTGWNGADGLSVSELPVSGSGPAQTLRIRMPWPPPSPRAPIYLWLRGDEQGRATSIRP